MAKYNWETIEKQFTHGIRTETGEKHYPTLTELSEKHNVPIGTINSRASRHNWNGKQEAYCNKVHQKTEEKRSEFEAEEIVEDDLLCESFGRKALKVAKKKLGIIERTLDEGKWVSSIDILNIVNSAKSAQEIMKIAQGEILERLEVSHRTGIDDLNAKLEEGREKARKRKEEGN